MKRYTNNCILTISDTHFPFHHQDVFDFLDAVRSEYNLDRVVHLGDISDSYCFSNYAKALEADNVPDEIKKMRAAAVQLAEMFPDMLVCQSNHDDRLYRKAKAAGIPRELVLPYKKFLGVEKYNWTWKPDVTLTVDSTRQKIYFCHTKGSSAVFLAKQVGMSVIMGHHHSKSSLTYIRTPTQIYFAADCGCLISDKGHAFVYNQAQIVRPMRSVVIIKEGKPELIPLITRGDRWIGKI